MKLLTGALAATLMTIIWPFVAVVTLAFGSDEMSQVFFADMTPWMLGPLRSLATLPPSAAARPPSKR